MNGEIENAAAAAAADDENETTRVMCLAIPAEKRRPPGQRPRPSGCAGIFYQLFDWNRRLQAKNNKNLLSTATPRSSTSKRFGAHDKPPPPPASKFHPIAEENGGGFPNAKKHRMDIIQHNHETRPASLVAKLMGLDSIPTVNKNKQPRPKMDGKLVDACSLREEIVVEEGLVMNGPRPQKQQKAVCRFGQDALQLKNVLSPSRKHLRNRKGSHHAKLPTPVKSPRVRSGKNAARLIDAATKILEPRLRVTNSRANAITHPHFLRHEMNQPSVTEGAVVKPPDLSTHSVYHSSLSNNFGMLSPCKNCGLPDDDIGLRQVKVEQLSSFQSNVSKYTNLSPQKWPCQPMTEEDNDKPFELDRNQPVFVVSQIQDGIRTHSEFVKDKKSFNSHGQKEWRFSKTPHQTEVQLPTRSSEAFSQQQQKTKKMPFDGESIPSRLKFSSLQSQRVTSGVTGDGAKHFQITA